MSYFYVTVTCPRTLRKDRVPVQTQECEGHPGYFVNTCENAPPGVPECARCVSAVWRELKDHERSLYIE